MGEFVPVGTCVGLPGAFITFILHRGVSMSYRWFARVADLREFRGWRLSVDWHVSFYKSHTPSGMPVVFFRHSGIEHVFLRPADARGFDPDREEMLAEEQGF